MIALTLEEIAVIVGGEVRDADPDRRVTGPAFLDTRSAEPGGLFVAFEGEHVDGHDFAVAALEGGAAAVLGTRITGVPMVLVDDSQVALQELARTVLARLRADSAEEHPSPVVVAITGSQGKTSVKDMLGAVLAQAGPTVATQGSFNNELGLPLTVLRVDATTAYLVLEMGARGVGHLRELCAIAPPDVSVVLNVGKAHLGEFGSQDQIARAKGEIIDALGSGGRAVLAADDPSVAAMARRTSAEIWDFGRSERARVRVLGLQSDGIGRPHFDLLYAGARHHVELQLVGEHQALNAAAAATAALACGLPMDRIVSQLNGLTKVSRWRMELTERADGLIVINDAYNANPDSMRVAMESLAQIGQRAKRRTVAVLGEMRELGPASDTEHESVGALSRRLGVDVVLTVGSGARAIHSARIDSAAATGSGTAQDAFVDTVASAIDWVRENVRSHDVVLVKASRAAELEQVAQALLVGAVAGSDEEVRT